MRSNFSIGQSNELLQDGRVFDLHNKYGFAGVEVLPLRCLRLLFLPDPVHGLGEPAISLEFGAVVFLQFSDGFGTREVPDVAEVGYKSPEDWDVDWLLDETQATSEDHFFLRLSPSDFIRVFAGHASLRTQGTSG